MRPFQDAWMPTEKQLAAGVEVNPRSSHRAFHDDEGKWVGGTLNNLVRYPCLCRDKGNAEKEELLAETLQPRPVGASQGRYVLRTSSPRGGLFGGTLKIGGYRTVRE